MLIYNVLAYCVHAVFYWLSIALQEINDHKKAMLVYSMGLAIIQRRIAC